MRSSRTDSSRPRSKGRGSGRPDLRAELSIQSDRLSFLEAALRGFRLKKASPAEMARLLEKARGVLRCEKAILFIRDFSFPGEELLLFSPRRAVLPEGRKRDFIGHAERFLARGRGKAPVCPEKICGRSIRSTIGTAFGRGRGFLLALNKTARPDFSLNDKRFIEAFTAWTVMVLDNLALFSQAQGRIRELSVLIKAGQLASSTLELNLLLYKLIGGAKEAVGAQAGSVILHDPVRRQLVFYITVSRKKNELERITMPEKRGIAGWVLRRRTACIVNDTRRDKRFYTGVDRATRMKTRSVLAVPLIAGDEAVGVIELINKKNGSFTDGDLRLLSAIASHSAMSIRNVRLFDRTRKLLLNTVGSLTQAIDAKDPYTAGHSDRVTYYSLLIARGLRMTRAERDKLRLAAILHDIGKIGIREDILLKKGTLSPSEWEAIRRHPVIGEKILSHIEEIRDILPGIRNHHERLDGTGYPDRAKGGRIALLGRVIAVADAFDAMTTDRPYRQRRDYEAAAAELVRCGGTQFDPEIVRVFIKELRREKLMRSRT